MENSQRVRVAVSIRPDEGTDCISVVHGGTLPQVQIGSKSFTFDYVYGGSTGSPASALYGDCVSPLVEALFDGRNATLIAYGQTGSGKTYTMGTDCSGKGSNVGVIPKVMEDIFQRVEVMKDSREFVIRVSFIEVLKNEVHDLLDPNLRARVSLQIREIDRETTVDGVTEAEVRTKEEMATHLSQGSHSRATGSTSMNEKSSRSHAIFTITMEQKNFAHNEDIGDDIICAKLLLVDLAGSEGAKQMGADAMPCKGTPINEDLLALGKVISGLGSKRKRKEIGHIPYRDRKLTYLLQDSLGGNSKTVMIACVRPAIDRKETLSTLTYANHARNIQNKAVVLQRKTEKASMSTKSCIDCREKDSEIRDLKEKVATLSKYTEKASMSTKSCIDCREKDSEIRDLKEKVATLSKYASKLEMEKAKLIHQKESLGYRSSSRLEDMDTSESEYLDDSDDDDWVLESEEEEEEEEEENSDSDDDDWVPESEEEEEEEKPVKKRICRTSVASNPLDTLVCSSCSKNSSCKTIRCPCHNSGRSCGTSCACKCAKRRIVKGGSPEFQIHESIP